MKKHIVAISGTPNQYLKGLSEEEGVIFTESKDEAMRFNKWEAEYATWQIIIRTNQNARKYQVQGLEDSTWDEPFKIKER